MVKIELKSKKDYLDQSSKLPFFIDKSWAIPLIYNKKHVLIHRPSKFGKTLFLSMLDCFHDYRKKDLIKEKFTDTGKVNSSQFYVLGFDFSQVNNDEESFLTSFYYYTKSVLTEFIDYYHLDIKLNSKDSLQLFEEFFFKYERHYPIYLLIDNYDNLINPFSDRYSSKIKKFVAAWFKVLDKNIITHSCIVGKYRHISDLVGNFTSEDITFSEEVNDIFGVSEKEVRKFNNPELLERFLEVAGYVFCHDYEKKVARFDHLFAIDPTPIDIEQLEYVISHFTPSWQRRDLLFHLLTSTSFITSKLDEKYYFNHEFDKRQIAAILFNMGVVSIKRHSKNRFDLAIVNKLVADQIYDYFIKYFYKHCLLQERIFHLDIAVNNLLINKTIDKFAQFIENELFNTTNRVQNCLNDRCLFIIVYSFLKVVTMTTSNNYLVSGENNKITIINQNKRHVIILKTIKNKEKIDIGCLKDNQSEKGNKYHILIFKDGKKHYFEDIYLD